MSTDGIRTDWANKDFYAELGVAKDATQAEIKKAYRKLARANHPDSNPGDTAKHEKFKAVAEAYDVVGDAEKRKKYDEMRELYGGGGFGGGCGAGGGGGFDLNDLLRDRHAGGGGGFGDLFGDLFGGGGGRAADPHARRPRRRRRDQRDDQLHRRHGRRHDQPAADLRRAVPRVPRHRRQARHHAARSVPSARAPASSSAPMGGAFSINETCPRCGGRQLDLRRGVPDLPRLRPRHLGPDDPGPHPRRRQGRPADPAARQGRGRRERRAGRRPLRHRQGDPAPALRPQGRQPHARRTGVLRRGRARRRDQGPDARGAPR